jgi:hypothetical protein
MHPVRRRRRLSGQTFREGPLADLTTADIDGTASVWLMSSRTWAGRSPAAVFLAKWSRAVDTSIAEVWPTRANSFLADVVLVPHDALRSAYDVVFHAVLLSQSPSRCGHMGAPL